MLRRRYVLVGRVQGVGLRWQIKQKAQSLGLTGWVRNEEEKNKVSLVIQGSAEAVRLLEDWLEQGLIGAKVQRMSYQDEPLIEEDKFYIDK